MIVTTDSPSQVMHLICTGDPILLRRREDLEAPTVLLDVDRTVIFSSDQTMQHALSIIRGAKQVLLDLQEVPEGLRVQLAPAQAEIPRGRRSARAPIGPTPYPARAAGEWSGHPLLTKFESAVPSIPRAWLGRPVFLELPTLTGEALGDVLSLTTLEGFEKTALFVVVPDEDQLPDPLAAELRAAGVEFWEPGDDYFAADSQTRLLMLERELVAQSPVAESRSVDSLASRGMGQHQQQDWSREKDLLLRMIRGD